MNGNTISQPAIIEFIEKKSKFIGSIVPVTSVHEAEEFIAFIKKQHYGATHNVPLYRLIEKGQECLKYNDDGEPNATAGKPMADIAVMRNIYGYALVATRYFGGIKLGASGLIRMYAKTAKLAFEAAGVVPPNTKCKVQLFYPYALSHKVNEFLARHKLHPLKEYYTESISIIIEIDEDKDVDDELYGVDVQRL